MSKSKGRTAGMFLLMILFCIVILVLVTFGKQSQFSEYWHIGLMISTLLNFLGLWVIYRLLQHIGRCREKYAKMKRKTEAGSFSANYGTGNIGDGKSAHDEISKAVTAKIEGMYQNNGGGIPIIPVSGPNATDDVLQSETGALGTSCPDKLAIKDFLAFLVEEYNAAGTDWMLQSQFLDRYYHAWFYVENSMARRQSPDTPPLFMTHANGFYMAVETKERQGIFYVFPRFGVSYSESVHGPGAMGMVFRPCNYAADESYDTMIVFEPALFTRKDKRAWSFEKAGSIKLML